jgi:uncharacterized protein
MNSLFLKLLVGIPLSMIVLYLVGCLLLYAFQNKLIFFPKKMSVDAHEISKDSTIEPLQINVAESKNLRGWLCKSPNKGKLKIIIYFGGNGDEVSNFIPQAKKFEGWSVVLLNYPGFGDSDGSPNEKSLYNSALSIYDYVISRDDVDANHIVIMGRSLGTGVATFLASSKPSRGVVLISPFESLSCVVKDNFGFFPVDLILKSKFDSRIYAPQVKSPLLCLCGLDDRTIAPKHSKTLLKFWGGETEYKEFVGCNHNDLIYSNNLINNINGFLKRLN